ncbi:MAG TPA: hypothetical protein VMB02_05450 [Candidatus Aquilonibacter sp.]|nr:hypothetical protein [Candidatus Aquilonibacter sp.]
MTKKTPRAKGKAKAPAAPKKRVRGKKPRARLHEDAVIHQDLFFAEAPMNGQV